MDDEPEAAASRLARALAAGTHRLRAGRAGEVVADPGAFATTLAWGEARLGITADGIGTKIEVAERLGVYDTLGFDLVAMVADDLAVAGFEPAALVDVLDVDRIDAPIVERLVGGLCRAAAAAGLAVVGGEIAALGERVAGWGEGMHFNWSATAVGTGGAVAAADAGDAVVAVAGRGLRANGFTLARAILAAALGPRWHERPESARRTWGEALLTPSLLLSPLLSRLRAAGVTLHAAAHVTGGGVPGKLGPALGGHGAILDQLHPPPDFVAELAGLGGVTARRAYATWNMGNPLLLVVPEAAVAGVLDVAAAAGFIARRAGVVTEEPAIAVTAPGGELLVYPLGAGARR